MWPWEAIIGHKKKYGHWQVKIQWLPTDGVAWEPTWELLANIAEDDREACQEYAKQHNLQEAWYELVG